MTEKKTFKNPDLTVFTDGSGWKITPEGVTAYSGNHILFHANEWDMEVTFTKKAEPIQINHLVQDADRYIGRVVAVQQDKAWVHYTTNQHGGIENFDGIEFVANLKRVG